MSEAGSEGVHMVPAGPRLAASAGPAAADDEGRRATTRSFKLRFAAQRELGRSNVSSVKPLGLPATVAGKFHRRQSPAGAAEEAALRRIKDMFERGPREKYPMPVTTSHEYGWWWDKASKMAGLPFRDRRYNHHIQDSAWLKARLVVLAADAKLKQH